MNKRNQLLLLLAGLIACVLLVALAERKPGLFANTTLLGGMLALEVALIGLAHFESLFFPLLIGIFLWAGSVLPLSSVADSLRWLFLGVGAFGGLILWIRSSCARHFGVFHLVSFFCVMSALSSAAVSDAPKTAVLKVTSLFLLFLYAAAGCRLAIAGREKQFLAGLVLACEGVVYLTAVCYSAGFNLFGNPNALGALVGVVAIPILLWDAVTGETRGLRLRRFVALILCGGLLYFSDSRASILGAAVALVLFTIAARHYRLLVQSVFFTLFVLTVMVVVTPSHADDFVASVTGRILYKDHLAEHDLLSSRLSPWAATLADVRRHPWLGSGFGTSDMGEFPHEAAHSSVYTAPGSNREHGSSYLAMAEYLGVLGIVPFAILLLTLIWRVIRAFAWVRTSANPRHPCVPFAMVIAAGLVHAGFEDWLFAVGSYLCVFFWVLAFSLQDLVPRSEPKRVRYRQESETFALTAEVSHSLR